MLANIELFNVNIERSILNTILFEPERFSDIRGQMGSNLFYHPFHRDIYDAMCSLADMGKGYDEAFLQDFLGNRFKENNFLEIMDTNPIYNIKSYVEQLQEYAQRRGLINLQRKIHTELESGALPDEIMQVISTEIEHVSELNSAGYHLIPIAQIKDEQIKYILRDWLPMAIGTVSMIVAPGGVGKTWLMIQGAVRYAHANPNMQAALWLAEDPTSVTKARAQAVCEMLGYNFNELVNLKIMSDEDMPPKMIRNKEFIESNFYKLRKAFRGYGFIGIDPIAAFYGGNENDNSEANKFMYPFKQWALQDKINILFLHHSAQEARAGNRSSSRGATAFVDGCRCVYDVRRIFLNDQSGDLDVSQLHMREVTLTKDNYGVMNILKKARIRIEATPMQQARELEIKYENISNETVSMPQV